MSEEQYRAMLDKLLPCPFCGTKDSIDIRENRLGPTMNTPVGSLISVVVSHHCETLPGVTGAGIEFRGREHAEAFAQWNQRKGL